MALAFFFSPAVFLHGTGLSYCARHLLALLFEMVVFSPKSRVGAVKFWPA
ncbi:hypothetical protein [Novosphingobium beihaiensis]|uniref:Uncharacterized protein n=1 Tax=Novosphingobium beihaiensis TaxID=2930389 RepID=A0ABT0BJT5_9SPHN|nr:hypothetical protein [Novosphingobium beihaiensis]MCJ2185284.1 hypothetical protein [Novosphingobium beihaiensis]